MDYFYQFLQEHAYSKLKQINITFGLSGNTGNMEIPKIKGCIKVERGDITFALVNKNFWMISDSTNIWKPYIGDIFHKMRKVQFGCV